ncbi:unnamed protein product [Caenorhabditis bovis]|uniref:Sodium/hydrogen exchanger n=1 Tax=Caenorhabditis bovis TaxID=2654633 RepID=A0A8S1E9I5_9PELO|nr:unnamed protein product [Caenorhabditis bovis]
MKFIFIATLWLLVTCIAKIAFTHLKKKFNQIPESGLQIFLGLALAAIFSATGFSTQFYYFDAHTFFSFLLPPIIFDAGFFMPNRDFFNNFEKIMVFAVIGTVFNTFAIGGSLAFLSSYKLFSFNPKTSEMLLFASLISAVDPVAVIAVFEEMHVNKPLFVTVFGEALFNDAISVVLFGIFKSFTLAADSVQNIDYFYGIISFFIVSLGGVLIGVVTAFATALLTKYSQCAPVIASLIVFILSYLGYVVSEIFSFSSIIAAAVCGMTLRQFIRKNVDSESLSAIKTFTRNLAISSESFTFILLGLAVISVPHHWDTLFVIATIASCLIYRFVAILGLSWILGCLRNQKINLNEQLVMCFGGLRGAIAFGIVVSMSDEIEGKQMFTTATLAVIFFSVIIQGMIIRPLLKVLKIKTLTNEEISIPDEAGIQKMEISEPNENDNYYKRFKVFREKRFGWLTIRNLRNST